jgi:hypothetical protein
MKKQPPQEESGEKAPLWIISFADMISLLMAFFVMLQTMATEHTNELFTTGRGAFQATMCEFRRNIHGFGVPGLFSNESENRSFNSPQKRHYFDSPQTEPVISPAADGDQEKMKRLFAGLTQCAKTEPPQVTGKIQNYTSIPVQFADGGSQLDAATAAPLAHYVTSFGSAGALDDAVVFYVVGSAPDVSSPSEQWVVSEQRAANVAAFLRNALPESVRENIFWWGAGAGGSWFTSTDITKGQDHILIVTLASPRP